MNANADRYERQADALRAEVSDLRRLLAQKDAQIAELTREREMNLRAWNQTEGLLQSANERIEAAEKLVVQAEEYFIVAAQRIDELQSQLSALQRAAREYVEKIDARIDSDTRWAMQTETQALLDLSKT